MTDDTKLILEEVGKLNQRMDKFDQRMGKFDQRMGKFDQRMDGIETRIDSVKTTLETQIENVKTTLEAQIENVKTTLKEDILRSRMEFAVKLRENMASLPTKEDYKKLFEYIEFIDKEIAEHRTSTETQLVSHSNR